MPVMLLYAAEPSLVIIHEYVYGALKNIFFVTEKLMDNIGLLKK